MDLIPKGWGSRLRAERKRLGHTQVEFARLTGVSTLTYQQYEREEYEPRLGYLNQLANLEVDIHFVMFGDSVPLVSDLAHSEQAEVMALNLIKEHLNKNPGKDIKADRLFALFDLFRSELEKMDESAFDLPIDTSALIKNLVAHRSSELEVKGFK